MALYPPVPRYGLHPLLPERLGYRSILKVVNPELSRLLENTDKNTLVTARNRTTIYREAKDVLRRGVPGDFVEFGVHRGGTAAVAAHVLKAAPDRHLHLFDRWGDLPEPTDEDGYRKEQYTRSKIPEKLAVLPATFNEAKHVIENVVGFPQDRLHYYQGWYDDTLCQYQGHPIAFASIDCDYYESVKPVIALCEKHASPGAVFIIDDYGTWPGARLAVHEWLERTPRKIKMYVLKRMGTAVLRLD